jgi:hypothetical protein
VSVRIGKIFVIVALIATTGAHWAALQTVAWTTMLADNLCTHTFNEAVAHTFDGQHPCCLCKAIAAGKKSEKKSEAASPMQKFEFPPLKGNLVLVAPSNLPLVPPANYFAESFPQKPPTPPPRGFFV